MKKCLGVLFLIVFSLTLPCISGESEAAKGGWKKYEDWESYPIGAFVDDDKWDVGDRCSTDNIADVSIADYNGSRQLRFSYYGTEPDNSCYVQFNDCPERIVGIKADVTVASCEGNQDCRGRVVWYRGTTPSDFYQIFESVQVRPNRDENHDGYITASASKEDQNNNWNWMGNYYWAHLYGPDEIIGETFTVSAIFDKPDSVVVTVNSDETITYKWTEKMEDPTNLFKAIGMRVGSGTDWAGNPRITNGDFVVYFDNIYIKTKGSCDNKKPKVKKIDPKKNVPLDACQVHITFSEPMHTCCENVTASAEWPVGTTSWSNDQKTLTIERSNCSTALPANTTIEFVVNPGGTGFMDLKGNEAKEKKLKIKTVK